MKLIIGNKNYSSWSLRAWLFLAVHDVKFEEVGLALQTEAFSSEIAKYNKAGKVPALQDNGLVVWDSLAILEYISEQYLDGKGWPADPRARAVARSCSAEMHSGFFTLRGEMPMNCRADNRQVVIGPELKKEIDRIDGLWSELRTEYGGQGPWLFGDFSIADCMFCPVVFRFATYNVALSQISKDYMLGVLKNPKVQFWLEQAKKEEQTIDNEEVGQTSNF